MPMDPKQLGAFIDRAKKKTDDRSRAPLSHYVSPSDAKFAEKFPDRELETVSITEKDMLDEDRHKAFLKQQEELEAQFKGKKDESEEEPLPEDPTDLDKLLE